MATGAPDWQGLNWKVEATLRPDLIYQSGKVLMHEDFESPIFKWTTTGTSGGIATLTTSKSRSGSTSAKLSTGNANDSYGTLEREISIPASKKAGVQFVFTAPPGTMKYFIVELSYFDATDYWYAIVRYVTSTHKWQHYGFGADWADIPGMAVFLAAQSSMWFMAKLSLDFNRLKFINFRVNDRYANMSTVPIRDIGIVNYEALHLTFKAIANSINIATIYIDDVFITEE